MLLEQARDVLDRFGVANRLQHVRQYVWRGGTLGFHAEPRPFSEPDVFYQLQAEWDAPVLEPLETVSTLSIEPATKPIAEGRWTRGTRSYLLRMGIDLAVPSAIYIKGTRLESFVPFVATPPEQVEHAIDADLAAYVNAFLNTCRPVPEAAHADARRCLALKI